MTTIAVSASTPTSLTLAVGDLPSDAQRVQVQYSPSPNFQWALSPDPTFAKAASITLVGLNQASRLYLRARAIGTSGTGPWSVMIGAATPLAGLLDFRPPAIMIEPALIAVAEPVLSWTADNERPGFPARALGRDDPNSIWMSTLSGGRVACEAVLSGSPIDTIAMLSTNASETASIKINAGPTLANVRSASPAFVMPAVPFRASAQLTQRRGYHALIRLPQAISQPVWRVEVFDNVPGSLFAATHVVFGEGRQTRNYAADSKVEALMDMGSIERDRAGVPFTLEGWRGRSVDFEIVQQTEAQYHRAFEQVRWLAGITGSVLIVPNTKAGPFLHDRMLYGQLTAGKATNNGSPRFSTPFQINSLI